MTCNDSPLPVRQPPPTMRGAKVRYRPLVPIHIIALWTLPPVDAWIDSAADDTVFPPHLAIDPTAAPQGQARLVGGVVIPVSYVR